MTRNASEPEAGKTAAAAPPQKTSLTAPLAEANYRNIWIGSLFSNLGQMISGVGAAWYMTSLSGSPKMVALVQTAMTLPVMVFALPAGAIADMFDRRKVALFGLASAFVMAVALTALTVAGLMNAWLLLAFCFLVGSGVALFIPAWQSSISEQVSQKNLPSAIALGSISFNVARSLGPAFGGVMVAMFGAAVAFGLNAVFYLPMMLAFLAWRRPHTPSRLPPQRLDRAILAGVRYAAHSSAIRIVLARTVTACLAGCATSALAPLIARDLLKGTASTYGLLLGAYGIGAVFGSMLMPRVRDTFSLETATRLMALLTGATFIVIGLSHNLYLTVAMMLIAGATWMILLAQFNVCVQMSAPRWVTARALACYSTMYMGGFALGAWIWGSLAASQGTGMAIIIAGGVLILTNLLSFLLPLPSALPSGLETARLEHEPEVALDIVARSGPILIEFEYRVPVEKAREFWEQMQAVRSGRLRSGAFNWTLARNIAEPELWAERYELSTWGDYLLQRERLTKADLDMQALVDVYNTGPTTGRVQRWLVRPFGSVRWNEGAPDRHDEAAAMIGAT